MRYSTESDKNIFFFICSKMKKGGVICPPAVFRDMLESDRRDLFCQFSLALERRAELSLSDKNNIFQKAASLTLPLIYFCVTTKNKNRPSLLKYAVSSSDSSEDADRNHQIDGRHIWLHCYENGNDYKQEKQMFLSMHTSKTQTKVPVCTKCL